MKVLFTVVLMASISAHAAPATPLPRKSAAATQSSFETKTAPAAVTTTQAPMTRKAWVMERLSIGGLVSQANTLKSVEMNNAFTGKRDGDFNTDSALGVMAQLTESAKWNNVGWYGGLSMDMGREISSFKWGSNTSSAKDKPKFAPWIAHGGLNYQFNSSFYLLGGFNYTLWNDKKSGEFTSFEMYPELGYQYGAGLNIKDVSVELVNREVAYNLSAKAKSQFGEVKWEGRTTLSGLNVQARYNF